MNLSNVRITSRTFFVFKNSIRTRSTTTMLEAETPKESTVDDEEITKHGRLANDWWNEDGEMKALHSMNKLRVPLIRDTLIYTKAPNLESATSPKPLMGSKILDVGCGGGILCEPLARIGADVTGIDAGKELIAVATQHAADISASSKIQYICGTIEEHSRFNKEVYDAVIASEVIEHVSEKDIFLESCADVLKPGGSIFITTVNRTMPAWVAGVIAAEHFLHLLPKGTHDWEKFVTPSEIQYMLEKHGCLTKMVHGMLYNFICNEWFWTPNHMINYALHAVKKK